MANLFVTFETTVHQCHSKSVKWTFWSLRTLLLGYSLK